MNEKMQRVNLSPFPHSPFISSSFPHSLSISSQPGCKAAMIPAALLHQFNFGLVNVWCYEFPTFYVVWWMCVTLGKKCGAL